MPHDRAARPERAEWGSRLGLILAAAGSAVGLGNFLRFPGQAAKHGGGAFMLPYFISLVVLGVPLAWAEWTMGRYGGGRGHRSAPGIYAAVWKHPAAKYVGGVALVVPFVIYTYYVIIETWCLAYALHYLRGDLMMGNDAEQYVAFFGRLTGMEAHGSALSTELVLLVIGTSVANLVIVARGVSKGIERFCMWAMPTLAVLAMIVLVRVLFLGTPDPTHPERSLEAGLGYMWNPRPEALLSPETWLAASSQIFFSISVGFGILVHYASYLRRKDDVALSALTATSTNELFEVCLGGLITIPASFVFLGALAPGALGSTFQLGFITLPNVFASMSGGRTFGCVWFFALFIAALTSSISMLQPVIAFMRELGMTQRRATAILGVVAAIGSALVLVLSKGLVALDTLDFWVGTFLIFMLATMQSLIYARVFAGPRGHEELNAGSQLRVPYFVQIVLKYVAPVYLLLILAAFLWKNLPEKVTEYASERDPAVIAALAFIAVTAAGIAGLVRAKRARWSETDP